MKQFIVLDHFLRKKELLETDVTPRVFDCIVPQKTTFDFVGDIKISDEDVVILRDSNSRNIEYLGVIDTIERGNTTRVAVLPFISICDNDLKLTTLDGLSSVQDWIIAQIGANFVTTDDDYSRFNIQFRDYTQEPIIYKAVDETSNLLDVLNEIYLNTGIYVGFTVGFVGGKVNNIYCDIYNANEQSVKKIRYDNPQIINAVDYKFSQYGNYSKASIQVGDTAREFYFYLRQDNKITTNPSDELRIKKVKNKNVKFTSEYNTEEELAEALVLLAQKTLCGDAFAYSIEFSILRRAISDWKFRQRCDFYAEDRLYQTFITNIEYVNDEEARVTLGAYRYTLTDKFKMLMRQPKEIGSTLNGIDVSTALGSTTFWFTQEDGNLYLNYPDGVEIPKVDDNYQFSIDENGNLWYEYDDTIQDEPDLEIETDSELVYKY